MGKKAIRRERLFGQEVMSQERAGRGWWAGGRITSEEAEPAGRP